MQTMDGGHRPQEDAFDAAHRLFYVYVPGVFLRRAFRRTVKEAVVDAAASFVQQEETRRLFDGLPLLLLRKM